MELHHCFHSDLPVSLPEYEEYDYISEPELELNTHTSVSGRFSSVYMAGCAATSWTFTECMYVVTGKESKDGEVPLKQAVPGA